MLARRIRHGSMRSALWACLLLLLTVLASPALAQTGTLRGKVTDAEGGGVLPYTNIILMDTSWGGITRDDGTFEIQFIPPGIYTVKATYIGFEQGVLEAVQITAGATTEIDFALTPAVVDQLAEVEVRADRAKLIDTKDSSLKTGVSSEDIQSLPVEEITDAIALKAGVTKRALYYHFDSKDALVAAVLDHQHALALDQIKSWGRASATSP